MYTRGKNKVQIQEEVGTLNLLFQNENGLIISAHTKKRNPRLSTGKIRKGMN